MDEIIEGYTEKRALYRGTRLEPQLKEAEQLMMHNEFQAAGVVLDQLKSKDELVKDLNELLCTKSFFKGLTKAISGKCEDPYEELVAYLSFGVHTALECKKGKDEYRFMLRRILSGVYDLDIVKDLMKEI